MAQPDIAALIDNLSSDNPYIRATAADKLGAYRATEAIPHLINLIDDKAIYQDEERVSERALHALKQMGPPVLEYLLTVFDKIEDLPAATGLLGFLGDSRAVSILLNLLDNQSMIVRKEAVEALGRILDERAVEPLIHVAQNDRAPRVRYSALAALGELGDGRALTPLVEMLVDDSNHPIQMRAAMALGQIGDPSAIPALESLVNQDETDDFVRREAQNALDKLQ